MSDTRSPYSEPVQVESPRLGSSRNAVTIVAIVARFDDAKFTTVQSLHLVGDDDTLQKTIFTADSKTSSDPE